MIRLNVGCTMKLEAWQEDVLQDCEEFLKWSREVPVASRFSKTADKVLVEKLQKVFDKVKLVWKTGGVSEADMFLQLYWLSQVRKKMKRTIGGDMYENWQKEKR